MIYYLSDLFFKYPEMPHVSAHISTSSWCAGKGKGFMVETWERALDVGQLAYFGQLASGIDCCIANWKIIIQ